MKLLRFTRTDRSVALLKAKTGVDNTVKLDDTHSYQVMDSRSVCLLKTHPLMGFGPQFRLPEESREFVLTVDASEGAPMVPVLGHVHNYRSARLGAENLRRAQKAAKAEAGLQFSIRRPKSSADRLILFLGWGFILELLILLIVAAPVLMKWYKHEISPQPPQTQTSPR